MMRDERGSIFNRAAMLHGRQLRLVGMSLLLTLLATELGFLQRIFSTVSLTLREWLVCIAVSLSLLVVEEVIKFFLRRRSPVTTVSSDLPAAPRINPQTA